MLNETNRTVTLADLANSMENAVADHVQSKSLLEAAKRDEVFAALKRRKATNLFNDAVASLRPKRKPKTVAIAMMQAAINQAH